LEQREKDAFTCRDRREKKGGDPPSVTRSKEQLMTHKELRLKTLGTTCKRERQGESGSLEQKNPEGPEAEHPLKSEREQTKK